MNDDERYAGYLEHRTSDAALDEGEVRELDALRLLLADAGTWDELPPDLADGIVSEISASRQEQPAQPVAAPRRGRRTRPMFVAMAAAAAVLVVVAVGALFATRSGDEAEQFSLAATDVVPGATGTATVEDTETGLSISLVVDGLPPAEAGTFYQAWMCGDGGSIPIGTFHAREGDGPIELWSGVDVADYPTMTVTVQQEGAGPESSGVVVLRGDIPEP